MGKRSNEYFVTVYVTTSQFDSGVYELYAQDPWVDGGLSLLAVVEETKLTDWLGEVLMDKIKTDVAQDCVSLVEFIPVIGSR